MLPRMMDFEWKRRNQDSIDTITGEVGIIWFLSGLGVFILLEMGFKPPEPYYSMMGFILIGGMPVIIGCLIMHSDF